MLCMAEVVIAPPSIYLIPVLESLRKDIKVAAQNCYQKPSGAFTGEISSQQLVDAGIPYVVLGASPPLSPVPSPLSNSDHGSQATLSAVASSARRPRRSRSRRARRLMRGSA